MYYNIKHTTTFHYSKPIFESVMEVRVQPRNETPQRALSFNLKVSPKIGINNYRDHLGNIVHHFDIPGKHQKLMIVAEALVEVRPRRDLPEVLDNDSWEALDRIAASPEYYDYVMPSTIAHSTELLRQLAAELNIQRRTDPLTLLREITAGIYSTFDYVVDSTNVDSPIDDALTTRQGVCQDFTHIMIALVRPLGIPCRYVSGYLFNRGIADRSASEATHAWVEAWLPGIGWVGFDPTNNLVCNDRHIRVAVGRDYADVPPTRGVYKGKADTKLDVSVAVTQMEDLQLFEEKTTTEMFSAEESIYLEEQTQQEQQQQ